MISVQEQTSHAVLQKPKPGRCVREPYVKSVRPTRGSSRKIDIGLCRPAPLTRRKEVWRSRDTTRFATGHGILVITSTGRKSVEDKIMCIGKRMHGLNI